MNHNDRHVDYFRGSALLVACGLVYIQATIQSFYLVPLPIRDFYKNCSTTYFGASRSGFIDPQTSEEYR